MKNKIILSLITINILAFFIQIFMPEGQTSVISFLIFSVVLLVIVVQQLYTSGRTESLALTSSKLILYIIYTGLLFYRRNENFSLNYIHYGMLTICILGLGLQILLKSKSKEAKASAVLRAQNVALAPGSITYIYSIITYPEDYGIWSLILWVVTLPSYLVAFYVIKKKGEPAISYIFPGFAYVTNIVYISVLLPLVFTSYTKLVSAIYIILCVLVTYKIYVYEPKIEH